MKNRTPIYKVDNFSRPICKNFFFERRKRFPAPQGRFSDLLIKSPLHARFCYREDKLVYRTQPADDNQLLFFGPVFGQRMLFYLS